MDILLTNELLFRRHISSHYHCPLCGVGPKTSHHALWEWNKVNNLWSEVLNNSAGMFSNHNNFKDMLVLWYNSMPSSNFYSAVSFLWLLWFRRNRFVHDNSVLNDAYLVIKNIDTAKSFYSVTGTTEAQ